MPSWRSGSTHGFCITGGHPPIASEPTPSPRLWATPSGATPARLCEHYHGSQKQNSKTGTFYLAGNRNFLFGSDRKPPAIGSHQQWMPPVKGNKFTHALQEWYRAIVVAVSKPENGCRQGLHLTTRPTHEILTGALPGESVTTYCTCCPTLTIMRTFETNASV